MKNNSNTIKYCRSRRPLCLGLCGIAAFVLILSLSGCTNLAMMEETLTLVPEDPDLSRVADGCFEGSHDGGMVKVSLEVTVENHVIKRVSLKDHECGKGGIAEVLVNRIVEEQSVELDTVSGATVSSLAILVSAERALRAGIAD